MKINGANVKKAYYYLKKNGLKQTRYAVLERLSDKESANYTFVPVSAEEENRQKQEKWDDKITFSIVVPMYETDETFAREMILSVLNQTYPHFELILADASSTDVVKDVADNFSDERIIYHKLEKNLGISDNTNAALKLAKGEYVALLDHDDLLTADALYENAMEIKRQKEMGMDPVFLYSDEDKLAEDGKTYYDPNIKPKFNKDLLLSNNYICHFLVMKREVITELGFRKEYDGAQDFDLVLRAAEYADEKNVICHIDKVLYHWRCHRLSTAANPQSKLYAYESGKKAVEDYLRRQKISATVRHTAYNGFYRVEYMDLFAQRKDVGVIAGPVCNKNKITGGICSAAGVPVYNGLNKNYGGYLHRAALHQDAEAVDFRYAIIRMEAFKVAIDTIKNLKLNQELTNKIVSFLTLAFENREGWLKHNKVRDEIWMQVNLALSKAIQDAGYLLYYDPKIKPLREDKL